MVAARKKPSAPAPPTSRTNSTQALPRAVNAKPHSKPSTTPDTSSQSSSKAIPNGTLQLKHTTKLTKSNSKTPLARKKKRSLVDQLFLLFLAAFAAYALYICPSDSHDSFVCHSLATYRTHVLEPYVIPPIRATFTHPAVVQPYEQYAKPVYQRYIQPVTPYIAAAQKQVAPYVNTGIRISKQTSSRVWNTVIKPYWSRAVVPRYTLYLQPHVNKYVSPLIKRAKYYNHQAQPYIRTLAYHTSIYAHKAQKYTLFVYDVTKPYAARAYASTKPHILHGYARIKPLLFKVTRVAQSKGKYVASEAMILSQIALGRVGDLRREFVDPHVLRIWEKAVEKSGPSQSVNEPIPTITASTTPPPTLTERPVFSDNANIDAEPATAEAAPQPTAVPEPSAFEPVPLSSTIVNSVVGADAEPEAPDAPTPEFVTPTPEETLEKAASIAEASAAHASNVIADLESEIKEAEMTQVVVGSTPDPVEPPAPAPTETATGEQSPDMPLGSSQAEPEDLDDFFREIGLNEEEKIPVPEPEMEPVAPPEEDLEARKAATAEKRANIVGRHVRWQSELDSLVKSLEARVKLDIEDVRQDAVAFIGRLPSDKATSVADGKGKEVLDKIQADGEKLLKGLDAYVKKLTSRTIPGEDLEKEKEKWEKIVEKVEGKFKDVVRGVQEDVHSWYVQVREQETSAVMAVASEAKALAERAQTDLGLDYAWLDDVTYYDWQNYHDLMRTYERFEQTARSLQNGTHTDAPEDNLIPVLNDLDREVQNMIAGFAVQMNSLVREGDRWLDSAFEASPESELEDEDEECEEYEDDVEEPQVSILPISPEPSAEKVDPANVVIGKSAEQVEKMAQEAVIEQRIEL